MINSQIDGDRLQGFKYLGYGAGVLGGFSVNETSWMLIELQYAQFGSKRDILATGPNLAIDLRAISVLLGYSLQFGDSWDGSRDFRMIVGPRYNHITEAESRLINEGGLRNYLSAQVTGSYFVTPNVLIDLSYTHALQNILDSTLEGFDQLVPYYFTLGVSWYLHR